MQLLNGKVVSDHNLEEVALEVARLKSITGEVPGLAVILVGDNPASQFYVASKKKACERVGFLSFEYLLSADVTQDDLLQLIRKLNQDPKVNGILLQLPLPKGLDESVLLDEISHTKDVDGFHPINVGKLLLGLDTFRSCTPFGVCAILDFYQIPTVGKHVVIVGRSNIVGKPLAAMLVQKGYDATVTLCHSRSERLSEIVRSADIVVAAVGKPRVITKDMIKPGAVVIDVGINRIDDLTSEKGYKVVGDVDFEGVCSVASAVTPVPGGVGPMTIAMLMKNTLKSFKFSRNLN